MNVGDTPIFYWPKTTADAGAIPLRLDNGFPPPTGDVGCPLRAQRAIGIDTTT